MQMHTKPTCPMIKLLRSSALMMAFWGLSQGAMAGSGLDFVQNHKQWPQQVQYKAGLPGGTVFFTPNSFVYSYYSQEDIEQVHKAMIQKDAVQRTVRGHAYRVLFEGSNASVSVAGKNKKAYYHNYFLGNDPSRWSGGVPVYEHIIYDELYPGIDLAVYSQGNSMKYDFIASAGTDPSLIRLRFEGVEPVLTEKGNIELRTSVNTVVEQAPYVYQVVDGVKKEVKCRYVMHARKTIGFVFPEGYDRGQALIIDPTLVFVTWSGAGGENFGGCATYDAAGNFYSTSQVSIGWPVTLGAFQTTPIMGGVGMADIGINKYNSSGSALIYSTYLGGNDGDGAIQISVNNNNELVVLGETASTDFPVTTGCFQNAIGGGTVDFFVVHFNATGTALVGSTYIGGSGDERSGDLRIDQSGNILCAGSTSSANFPITPGAYQPVKSDSVDGCIFKLNATCSALLSSTYIGGSGDDIIESIAQKSNGSIVVCGGTNSGNYPTTPGAMITAAPGNEDGFVSVLNATATALQHSTYLGTGMKDRGYKLQVDTAGNIYAAGYTVGAYPVTPGLYNNTDGALFVQKLSPSLAGIQSTRLGGDVNFMTENPPFAFLVDACGYVYYAIFTGDTSLATTPGAFQSSPATMYIGQLNTTMTALNYGTFLGSENDGAHTHGKATFDPYGNLYTSLCMGSFAITTPGAWAPVSLVGGLFDGLSFKFKLDTTMLHALPDIAGNDTGCAPYAVQFVNNSSNGITYLWDFGDGNTSTAFAPAHTYTAPGAYQVVLKAYNPATCKTEDSSSLVVTVLANEIIQSVTDTVLCQPGALVLQAPPGYQSFLWQDGSVNSSLSVSTGGTYFVTATGLCAVRTDTFHVEAVNLSFSLGPDTTVCIPYSLSGPLGPGLDYLWSNGSTAPQITVNATDHYWLSVSGRGCTRTDTVIVTYKDNKATASDVFYCNNEPINLRLTTTIPPGSTALWSIGSTDSHIVVNAAGTYWVTVTEGTCYTSDTTEVIREYCECNLFVPNAFSPNDDGRNDMFLVQLPSGCTFSSFTLSVYNRWGERIFTSHDPLKGWDGTVKGIAAEQGVYMYTVEGYTGIKKVHKKQKGDITLIR
jgi:gliding motility-associated-like protein